MFTVHIHVYINCIGYYSITLLSQLAVNVTFCHVIYAAYNICISSLAVCTIHTHVLTLKMPLYTHTCVYTHSNGDHYDGDWVAGKRHGQGLLRCANGTIYDVCVHC